MLQLYVTLAAFTASTLAGLRARLNDRTEHGLTSVEWLMLIGGVLTIGGITLAAVSAKVRNLAGSL